MNKRPRIISIAGPSGVGKTTLARVIASALPWGKSRIISGDAFHKWERGHAQWKTYTHLNPLANDLAGARDTLRALRDGRAVFLREYNHHCGVFEEPQLIRPTEVIIYEGLHAFYDKEVSELADVKIYVDTHPSFTREWKLARDVSSRGYTEEEVERELERRREDQRLYVEPMKEAANMTARFIKTRSGAIKLSLDKVLGLDIEKAFGALSDFLEMVRQLASEPSLVQGAGGNFSVKYGDKFIIKASGCKISEINGENGYVICQRVGRNAKMDESAYERFIADSLFHGGKRPSMELGLHAVLPERVVLHTHPTYLNAILCAQGGKEIIESMFDGKWVDYVAPGHELYNVISHSGKGRVWFLQNHGLIVTGGSASEVVTKTNTINNRCKKWLSSRSNNLAFHEKGGSGALFPDAVVYPDAMQPINELILGMITAAGLRPKFLTDSEKEAIMGLAAEKYRITS